MDNYLDYFNNPEGKGNGYGDGLNGDGRGCSYDGGSYTLGWGNGLGNGYGLGIFKFLKPLNLKQNIRKSNNG
jgi:hypothetical protein